MTNLTQEVHHFDVSDIPELMRIVQEVEKTKQPCVLEQDGKDLAVVMPINRIKKSRVKGKPLSKNDSFSKLIGSAIEAEPTDASKKHEYLAEAFTHHQQ